MDRRAGLQLGVLLLAVPVQYLVSQWMFSTESQRSYAIRNTASVEPRTYRPPEVKYRIGQVVKHKRWGYRGVIVGWDEFAKAPEYWIKNNHPPGMEHWRTQPNYAIIVDTRDRLAPQITYVPQENLEVVVNMQILHPSIEEYFEKFDGAQYLPRPWLKAVYPYDY
ncbi:F-box only protein 21-like [Ruditapes philippinarum]|uniref:F-box only protein 21-like n=1 Tax=Ruditapes philippinarum TaxID=129788 RepID=UPI00295AAA78|nr:F-box only protein 21-like [Ruditapes philippinarum]